MFSRRARIQFEGVNEFSRRVESAREQGLIRYDLTLTNPTRAGIDYDWDAIKAALCNAAFTSYSPDSLGAMDARRELAAYLDRAPTFADGFCDLAVGCEQGALVPQGELALRVEQCADKLMLTASSSEAYSYLFKLLCEPGDCVLVPTPSYPLLERLAAYDNVTTVDYRLVYDGAWHVDRASVTEAMAHRPRAIVVVSPNNPTGSCVSADEFEFLAQFGVPLIVDQVFAPYVLQPGVAARKEQLTNTDTLTFVLDGLSKRCGLPQLKLGWVSVYGPEHEALCAMTALAHLADTYLSVNRPVEAALGALLSCTSPVRSSIRQRLASNLQTLDTKTRNTVVTPLHYQGGWSAILRLPAYHSDEEWALKLLARGVLVQPGWLHDMSIAATVVLSLLTPCAEFAAGIEMICGVCAQ